MSRSKWTPKEQQIIRDDCVRVRNAISSMNGAVKWGKGVAKTMNSPLTKKFDSRVQNFGKLLGDINTLLSRNGDTVRFTKHDEMKDSVMAQSEFRGETPKYLISVNANTASRNYYFTRPIKDRVTVLFHEVSHIFGTHDSDDNPGPKHPLEDAEILDNILETGLAPNCIAKEAKNAIEQCKTFTLNGDKIKRIPTVAEIRRKYKGNFWMPSDFRLQFTRHYPGQVSKDTPSLAYVKRNSDEEKGVLDVLIDKAERPLIYFNYQPFNW